MSAEDLAPLFRNDAKDTSRIERALSEITQQNKFRLVLPWEETGQFVIASLSAFVNAREDFIKVDERSRYRAVVATRGQSKVRPHVREEPIQATTAFAPIKELSRNHGCGRYVCGRSLP